LPVFALRVLFTISRGKEALAISTLEITLGPNLTAEEAQAIYEQGPEAVVFALLQMAQLLAEKQGQPGESPSTPSGMKPVYAKEAPPRRRKKPGRKQGHHGSRRPRPPVIHQQVVLRLQRCPVCQSRVTPCQQMRTRIVEDIPESIHPVVTQYTIHRDWCPQCRQRVEPKVLDALPGAQIGNHVLVLSAWLHYGWGVTLDQILAVFNFHLHFQLSAGGLVQMWYHLQEILFGWYDQIKAQALQAKTLFADETGGRVKGKTWWLWCFTTADLTSYLIDRCRGSPLLRKFFQREFQGILVSDFWGAYNAIGCMAKQKCIPHLLRDLLRVEKYEQPGRSWPRFAKKLRRLLRDAMRLSKHSQRTAPDYASRRQRLRVRLRELLDRPWQDKNARRLVKRLRRHQHELFTFLDHPEVPYDNNTAERALRPAVIIRKNSYANRSEAGADMQAVLMSIFRTLKQRGHNPLPTIVQALRTYLQTGQLPPLPDKVAANG
jgi:transposase